jgi:hypothetical protein
MLSITSKRARPCSTEQGLNLHGRISSFYSFGGEGYKGSSLLLGPSKIFKQVKLNFLNLFKYKQLQITSWLPETT